VFLDAVELGSAVCGRGVGFSFFGIECVRCMVVKPRGKFYVDEVDKVC